MGCVRVVGRCVRLVLKLRVCRGQDISVGYRNWNRANGWMWMRRWTWMGSFWATGRPVLRVGCVPKWLRKGTAATSAGDWGKGFRNCISFSGNWNWNANNLKQKLQRHKMAAIKMFNEIWRGISRRRRPLRYFNYLGVCLMASLTPRQLAGGKRVRLLGWWLEKRRKLIHMQHARGATKSGRICGFQVELAFALQVVKSDCV